MSAVKREASRLGVGTPAAPIVTRARCFDAQGTNTELFFSERPSDILSAKAICVGCELRERCLAGALRRCEPVGVWGGECFHNGRVVETRKGRGRPRKNRAPTSVGGVDLSLPARTERPALGRGREEM